MGTLLSSGMVVTGAEVEVEEPKSNAVRSYWRCYCMYTYCAVQVHFLKKISCKSNASQRINAPRGFLNDSANFKNVSASRTYEQSAIK
jgi:hypothetical protein